MKEYRFKINGREYDVAVNGIENGVADVTVNGKGFNVELNSSSRAAETSVRGTVPGNRATLGNVRGGTASAVGPERSEGVPGDSAPDTAAAEKRRIISSPLPGVVLELYVMPGQAVKRGDRLAVIEAMKMENDILAECDGTVSEIYVTKGSPVDEGARLMLIS